MALVAQEWRARLEQVFCGGAMRVMADRAVFGDGLVVVDERSAFLHVAGVAGCIHAIALHQFGSHRTMRVMTIGTGHLALWNRVMGRLVDLHALILVAGEANLRLGAFVAHLVLCRMQLVAGGAIHFTALVRTAHPVRASRVLLVANQTGTALVARRFTRSSEGFDLQGAGVIVLTGDFLVRGSATVA